MSFLVEKLCCRTCITGGSLIEKPLMSCTIRVWLPEMGQLAPHIRQSSWASFGMAQWIRRPPTERKIPGLIPGVEACSFAMLGNQSMHDQHHYMFIVDVLA